MQASEIFHSAAGFIALAGVLGIALLLPLYLSQRRDVVRLRAWKEREPGHPVTDIAASEAALDRAEGELEELLGDQAPVTETGEAPEVAAGTTPSEPVTAAYRVTHERPALERITMERAALVPHPRWRRFVARATQPRALIAIGAAALLLGAGAIFVSEELLRSDEGGGGAHAGAIDRADVTVAVLNGTSVSGLGSKVGSDVEASGYKLGAVTNTAPGQQRTIVLYSDGQKRAAEKVAKDLGVNKVKPLDPDSKHLAGGADVVVIAGEDRAQA